ncbi:MAG: methylenetetrahydrofolate reductase [NAD(P)H] [Chloroflexi bacterium]|nr:methylenetetrahydrofolate reductase [NAD(P)H] [Chloroflexota bacterium]
MKFADYYRDGHPAISFELFPPRTEAGLAALEERLPRLISLKPSFITVTYGAMGTTRERTLEIASKIRNEYGMETAHHLTCVASSRDEMSEILEDIRKHNIENIVALRGDPPQGEATFTPPKDGYSHANELVQHIRRFGGFGVAVAGYPEKHTEAPDLETDLGNLKRKLDAGADAVITQLYYDNRHFYEFVDRCRSIGIQQPIVPGLMPILNVEQIKRITGLCGATIPPDLLGQLEGAKDDEERVHQIGITHTANQALDLLNHGVPGIHFYVLNQYFHIAEIMERIRPALPHRNGEAAG